MANEIPKARRSPSGAAPDSGPRLSEDEEERDSVRPLESIFRTRVASISPQPADAEAEPGLAVTTAQGLKVATLVVMDVFVEVRVGELNSLTGAALLQQAIDGELLRSGRTNLLVNAVDMSIAPKEVNDFMWRWAHSHPLLKKIAVLNRSPVMSVAVRMRAVAQRQRLAAFEQYSEAVGWLRER